MRDTQSQRCSRFQMFVVAGAMAVLSAGLMGRGAPQDGGPGGRGRGRGGPAGLTGPAIVAVLDTDGQEGLSASEIARAPDVLGALDKNGDGRVTPDELPSTGRGGPAGFRGGPGRDGREGPGRGGRGDGRGAGGGEAAPAGADDLTATLMGFDQNKDGKLTRAEVPERFQGLFDRADANKDNELTAEEIRRSAQAQMQSQPQQTGRGGRDDGPGAGPAGRGGPFGADALMSALDTNRDGALNRDEMAALSSVLRRFDRNADGLVTREEIFGAGRGRE